MCHFVQWRLLPISVPRPTFVSFFLFLSSDLCQFVSFKILLQKLKERYFHRVKQADCANKALSHVRCWGTKVDTIYWGTFFQVWLIGSPSAGRQLRGSFKARAEVKPISLIINANQWLSTCVNAFLRWALCSQLETGLYVGRMLTGMLKCGDH